MVDEGALGAPARPESDAGSSSSSGSSARSGGYGSAREMKASRVEEVQELLDTVDSVVVLVGENGYGEPGGEPTPEPGRTWASRMWKMLVERPWLYLKRMGVELPLAWYLWPDWAFREWNLLYPRVGEEDVGKRKALGHVERYFRRKVGERYKRNNSTQFKGGQFDPNVFRTVTVETTGLHQWANCTTIELHGSYRHYKCAEREHVYDTSETSVDDLNFTCTRILRDGVTTCNSYLRPATTLWGEQLSREAWMQALMAVHLPAPSAPRKDACKLCLVLGQFDSYPARYLQEIAAKQEGQGMRVVELSADDLVRLASDKQEAEPSWLDT